MGASAICSPVSVKANSETHAILNYEGGQEKENRDTLKNWKTFFLFA